MNREEKLADDYLKNIYNNVLFEPDGNIPPDFLINNDIAVEVRRLNQHKIISGKYQPLDNKSLSIFHSIEKAIESIKSENNNCYIVSIDFEQPIDIRFIKKEIINRLKQFLGNPVPLPCKIEINDSFSFEIYPAEPKYSSTFILGAMNDLDNGGFILSLLIKNINICIDEKTEKIQRYRNKYRIWWLILIDTIGYGSYKSEINSIKSKLVIDPVWSKIIILNTLNGEFIAEIT